MLYAVVFAMHDRVHSSMLVQSPGGAMRMIALNSSSLCFIRPLTLFRRPDAGPS